MNNSCFNIFTINKLETVLALVTSYPNSTQQKTVPTPITYLDVDLQYWLIQALETCLTEISSTEPMFTTIDIPNTGHTKCSG